MKKYILLSFLFFCLINVNAQNLKPYTIGVAVSEKAVILKPNLLNALAANDLEVVGEYKVKHVDNSWVIVFTCDELISAVEMVGGLTGFAATLRVAITTEEAQTIVSYTTPAYWGNAYFRKDFDKVDTNYAKIEAKLKSAISVLGASDGEQFGSKKGLSVKAIRDYQYMFGMPDFDDTQELESFDSFEAAVTKINASVKKGIAGVEHVYNVEFPNKELALYGFGLTAEDGENKFMPIIDISNPKHTAFLPYEILVMGDDVHLLHGRYRIALSFPDLTMGTFTKIMSAPGYIKDALEQVVK